MRFKELLLEAVLIVALLLGASALTSGQTKAAVDEVQQNTAQTAQYIKAQTCILAIDPTHRTPDNVNRCLSAAGISP